LKTNVNKSNSFRLGIDEDEEVMLNKDDMGKVEIFTYLVYTISKDVE